MGFPNQLNFQKRGQQLDCDDTVLPECQGFLFRQQLSSSLNQVVSISVSCPLRVPDDAPIAYPSGNIHQYQVVSVILGDYRQSGL